MSRLRKLSAVSLFSGAGGLDIGLELAGFEVVGAVDNDADCVATLRANQSGRIQIPGRDGVYLEHANLIESPIEDVNAASLKPRGTRGWRPDLLVGGPPCQPFSSSGKQRSLSDPRGRLFEEFVRIAEELTPRTILFENVRGLITAVGPSGQPGEALALVKDRFEEIGYGTTFALLNAADFGVPQRRFRLFMLATLQPPIPQFPYPTHTRHPADGLFVDQLPWETLGEFLASQPDPEEAWVVRPSESVRPQLERLPPGTGVRSPGAREATRPGGHWGYKQGMFVADLYKPARTVTAASTQDWVRDRRGTLRRLTWRECAGLQGFPPEWIFVGSKASVFRQIGNAVPSQLGELLGTSLKESLQRVMRSPAGPPASAPLPRGFTSAIDYTKRERERNGHSRMLAREAYDTGMAPADVKGFGSADKALGVRAGR